MLAAPMNDFDDIVIGAGMAGLTAAALLARAGRKVLVLEAHDTPGGYAHTFSMRGFRFCAQVHYIFGCGEGEAIDRFLRDIDAADEVPFVRLDPEGFDHVVVSGDRVRVPNGLRKFEARLARRYPEWRAPLRGYFDAVIQVADELERDDELPRTMNPWTVLRSAARFRHLLRYLRSTLADVYDAVKMPPHLRAILAGQSGDYLLPPEQVSFILHVALVAGYDRGAYYPRKHFFHFVETIADTIRRRPGCALLLEQPVTRIEVSAGRAAAVVTADGKRFTAQRFLSNVDPKLTRDLVGAHHFAKGDAQRFDYAYSSSTFTLYLGLRGLDLREHGFGSHNVWHYPHDDIGAMYRRQLEQHDLSDPWLFMSTPSLHTGEPGICPPGHQILEVATACDHARMAELRRRDRRAYNHEKRRIREQILDVIEAKYVPRLREHLVLRLAGTPATNERFCRAPAGNAYGAALTPRHVHVGRRPFRTSIANLWLANATAGFPSVAGAVAAGARVFRDLDGEGMVTEPS